jgi:MYXO-CTERM domain-containing protein
MSARLAIACWGGALLALTACTVADDEGSLEAGWLDEGDYARGESWIINGQIDTEHDAVVAVFSQQSGCTGTIIHVDGPNAYVLTAAHCFGFGPLQEVVIADNYGGSIDALMNVAQYQIHPQYDSNQSIYDFAMVRASGAPSWTPSIPAMTPSEDSLGPGSAVLHVGYGLTSYPNGNTSQRHKASGQLSQAAQIEIAYNQPVSGPCSGDSGGPNLADNGAGERVAGVVSYGDQQCNQFGVSGRVSAVYDSFIVPFIGYDPTSGVASSSVASSTASTGVGGDPSGGVGGAGAVGPASGAGAGAPSDGWTADIAEKDYDGRIQISSGCSTGSSPASRSSWDWLALALAGVGLGRRRTRRADQG